MALSSIRIAAGTAGVSLALVAMAGSPTVVRRENPGEFVYRVHVGGGRFEPLPAQGGAAFSVAREWKERLLTGIRNDRARPTVHARNLYHVSAAMWDAWAAYDDNADQLFHTEKLTAADVQAAREEAISFAAYRVLFNRFITSPGAAVTIPAINNLMTQLGYDRTFTSTVGDSPAALGNRVGAAVIAAGLADGSNQQDNYANQFYEEINPPLFPELPGNPSMIDPNRWQPLAIEFFIDQSGNPVPFGSLEFLSPEWGAVDPFALQMSDATVESRDGFDYVVFHDPGAPPYLNGVGDDYYRWGNEMVVVWSAHLAGSDPTLIDISPNAYGDSGLPDPAGWANYYDFLDGGDSSPGRGLNPATGLPYPTQVVKRGDYARVLAEFWADGPDSETPPGHWFEIANYVTDHPLFERRFEGTGPELDALEWDVKLYVALGGAMHDCAITAWGCKGRYDYVRPISAVRYMADQGQSSDPLLPSYNPEGIRLIPNFIELITTESAGPGGRHENVPPSLDAKGNPTSNIGKIAVFAWRGPGFITDPLTDEAGVGWILAENWWPYQRPSFVTPPFAGYVSGHSTYSRGAAELLTRLTGSEYFPGGVGEFFCPQDEFLVFEQGPSTNITLQWATYQDASDQTSLSRIWGGIHPPADDLPGRVMGHEVGIDAFRYAKLVFDGRLSCYVDLNGDGAVNINDVIDFVNGYNQQRDLADLAPAPLGNQEFNVNDVIDFINLYNAGCP